VILWFYEPQQLFSDWLWQVFCDRGWMQALKEVGKLARSCLSRLVIDPVSIIGRCFML
jgi:hypothetical protein